MNEIYAHAVVVSHQERWTNERAAMSWRRRRRSPRTRTRRRPAG